MRYGTAMLFPILIVGVTLLQMKAERRIRGTRASVVNRFCLREEDNLLTRLAEAVAPVHILSIHEELRIRSESGEAHSRNSRLRSEPLLPPRRRQFADPPGGSGSTSPYPLHT